MNQQSTEPETEINPEIETGPDPPQIYVASLSDYNAGRLHGRWIALDREIDEVWEDIDTMLRTSREPGAEEFAIHDYQGFGAWKPGEYESIDDVHATAVAIDELGPAITHWIEYLSDAPSRAIESFEEAYLGTWARTEDYVDSLVEDVGLEITVDPPSWEPYVRFDYSALARDLSFELFCSETDDGDVHIFNPAAAA